MYNIDMHLDELPNVDELEKVARCLSLLTFAAEISNDKEDFEYRKNAEWLLWRNISKLKKYIELLIEGQ